MKKPSKFPVFIENVRRICGTKDVVFGLEYTRGFGSNLSAYPVGRKFDVHKKYYLLTNPRNIFKNKI